MTDPSPASTPSDSLRHIADLLDEHPELPAPYLVAPTSTVIRLQDLDYQAAVDVNRGLASALRRTTVDRDEARAALERVRARLAANPEGTSL